MSSFGLLFQRDDAPVDGEALRRLLAPATDGHVRCDDRFALGQSVDARLPASIRAAPPASSRSGEILLVLDGRLDNREELQRSLELEPGLSDPQLALAGYEQWGRESFARLLGPFAIVVVDRARRVVLCARDALGDRTLFYALDDRRLAVASEETALLALAGLDRRLDEGEMARHLALVRPTPGRTFFAAVRELVPGAVMEISPERGATWRFWEPDRLPALRYRRSSDYAEQFSSLLAESARCRMRGASRCAVLLSGGLDSSSLVARMAQESRRLDDGRPQISISWVFDELETCDERRYIEPLVAAFGLSPVWLRCDGEWPLRHNERWAADPNSPMQDVFYRLKLAAYGAARESGADVLLSGHLGDSLYGWGEGWFRDLVAEGGARETVRDLVDLAGDRRRWPGLAPRRLRAALGRALGGPRHRKIDAPGPWIKPAARRAIGEAGDWPPRSAQARRPAQIADLLNYEWARGIAMEIRRAVEFGIEPRFPYRDRRLVEFALTVPGHVLFRPGATKWVAREAGKGVLPEEVRMRQRPTSHRPLAWRGLKQRELTTARRILDRPDAVWRGYLREEWMRSCYLEGSVDALDGRSGLAVWRAICAQLWVDGAKAGG